MSSGRHSKFSAKYAEQLPLSDVGENRRKDHQSRSFAKYSADDFVGIPVETASVAEHDPLRLPGTDFPDHLLRLGSLQPKWNAHAEKNLAARSVHATELRKGSPWLRELVQLEVHDGVGENQRSGVTMEKHELLEDATRNQGLVDFTTPILRRSRCKVLREMDIHVSCASSLPHALGCPCNRSRKRLLPFADM